MFRVGLGPAVEGQELLDGAARMASAVARCFPGDQFFSFIDLLFANQMNWIKDFDNNQQITKEDVLEGLAQLARQAGMPREKVATRLSTTLSRLTAFIASMMRALISRRGISSSRAV